MKTIQDFYDKYGTGKNYEDLFAMMCHAKRDKNPNLAIDVEQFVSDLKTVCENDFDELLWRDYQFITTWPIDEDEEEEEDEGEPDYVLKSENCTQAYATYAKACEGFGIYHNYYVREGWTVVCEHKSKRAIVVDGVEVRALRNVYRKNGKTVDLCLSVRIEID